MKSWYKDFVTGIRHPSDTLATKCDRKMDDCDADSRQPTNKMTGPQIDKKEDMICMSTVRWLDITMNECEQSC